MEQFDPAGLVSLPRSGSRGQAVFDALRHALREGHLRSGMYLREEQIAESFSVSRTPVREAFSRLLGQSILEHAGGRGLIVRTLRDAEIFELYAMREVLEGAAASFAATHAGPAEIATLEAQHARFVAQSVGAVDETVRWNQAFHATIRQAARNQYLDYAFDDLADGIALLGETTLGEPSRHSSAIEEHAAILTGIRSGDAGTAERAARAHIRAAFQARATAI